MIVCQFAIGAFIGALISAIWDDDDEGNVEKISEKQQEPPTLTQRVAWGSMMQSYPDADDNEVMQLAKAIVNRSEGRSYLQAMNEMRRVSRILYSDTYDSSTAEINSVKSIYGLNTGADSEVSVKRGAIYDSIDPADDDDSETDDAFAFETEVENLFGVEQMASSEEDIQSETDVRDPSSVDPIDEITQDEEVGVGDTTTGVESETEVTEEVFFQEAVIYPNVGDFDIDPTDDNEDLYIPDDEYRPQEEIEARIEFMEQALDDAVESLNANVFESMAGTFYQDDSEPVELMDDPYFADDIDNSLVIDFSSPMDDVGDVTDLIDDTFGNAFFQWMESSANESLDINPASGFNSPYGILGRFD